MNKEKDMERNECMKKEEKEGESKKTKKLIII